MITLKKTILSLLIISFATAGLAQERLLTLNLFANSIKYDNKRNCFYATVNSADSLHGNQFVKINPKTGKIVASITIGQNPTCMDLTKDTNYVYVGFGQDSVVKRIDLTSFLVDRVIPIYGAPGFFNKLESRKAVDVASVNLSPDMVVIATKWFDDGKSGVSNLLCNYRGKYIGDTIIYYDIYTSLESATDTNVVFSNSIGDFSRYLVDTINGLTQKYKNPTSTGIYLHADFKINNHLAIAKSGYVYDIFETPMKEVAWLKGNEMLPSYNSVDYISKDNIIYFGQKDGRDLLIYRFDFDTKSFIDMRYISHNLPNFRTPSLIGMHRYDEYGIAMLFVNNTEQKQDRLIVFSESCAVKDGVDLQISNILPRIKKYVGDTAEVFVTVINGNNMTANQVIVQTNLSTAFDLLSIRASSGTAIINDSAITWSLDSISKTQFDTLFVLLRYKNAGQFEFVSSVSAKTFDCLSAYNKSSAYFEVEYPTGLTDFELLKTITSFPNPTNELVTIDFGGYNSTPLTLTVSDIHGKALIQQTLINYDKSHNIDFKNLTPGVYFIQIENTKKQVKHLKIVKI